MRPSPVNPNSGKSLGSILGALVAVAFLVLCTVLVVTRLERKGKEPPAGGTPATGGASTPAGALEISFYTSSAKKNWVDEMIKSFHASGATAAGKPIRVKAVHVNSGDSLEQLKEGKIRPDLWSPGDESWLELANQHWKRVKQKALFDDSKPLVDVPLVIAMWEPMARAMGYPKPIGWKDIAKLAADPRGWASLGHPEWGPFRWGHAHPDANSGFLTVLALVYAALGKTEGITNEDLKKPEVRAFVQNLERRVEHYGLSNTWLDDVMHARGPAYLSAAVQYENTIIETNEKHQNKPGKLVAVYLKEGTFWTRHPVVAPQEDWATPERLEAGRKFVDFLRGETAQRRAVELGLRPFNPQTALAAPFDDEHGVNPKLTPEIRLSVPDEKVLRRVIDLWEEVKVPATVVFILDRSGSMKGTAMDSAKEGAVQFVKSMKPADEIEVQVFSQGVTKLVELCPVKQCGEAAVDRLQGVFAEGGTALYDAVLQGYRSISERRKKDPSRRYGIVVLTDGMDTSSTTSKHDFLDALPEGESFDVPKIYTIAYGAEADRTLLREISNRTNARLFESTATEIAKTYKELSANF